MNKQEWMEYFEAINKRLPNQEEMQAALANGEFTEEVVQTTASALPVEEVATEEVQETAAPVSQEVPVQETAAPVNQEAPVQETVVPANQAAPVQEAPAQASQAVVPPVAPSQPVQEQSVAQQPQQQQYQMPQQPQQQYQVPQQPGKFQIMMKDFWTWFQSSLKAPTSVNTGTATNGYIIFGLLSFFYALTLFLLARLVTRPLSDLSALAGTNYNNPIGFQAFLIFCLVSVLSVFSVIFAGFVVKRFVFQDASFTFPNSFEWYGRHFAISLILVVVACLFALLGIATFAGYLLFASFALLGVVGTFNIARSLDTSNNMDKFYKYLLAFVVNILIIAIIAFFASSLLTSYAQHSIY